MTAIVGGFRLSAMVSAHPKTVFQIYENPNLRRDFLFGFEGIECLSFEGDFRPGGMERASFRFPGGGLFETETEFVEVAAPSKIRIKQLMDLNGKPAAIAHRSIDVRSMVDGSSLTLDEDVTLFESGDCPERHQDFVTFMFRQLALVAERLERAGQSI